MKKYKVRCVDNNGREFFEKGEVYDVEYGILMYKKNYPYNVMKYLSVDEINKNCVPQFELVEEIFTKSDLKDGMVVTYRNGNTRLVFNNRFYDTTYVKISGNTLDNYDDNLKMKGISSEDIVKVEYMGTVLWEREKEYFTLEEAFKPNRLVKHKDCIKWCNNAHLALYEACETTKRDMFELLKAKEFEYKEV